MTIKRLSVRRTSSLWIFLIATLAIIAMATLFVISVVLPRLPDDFRTWINTNYRWVIASFTLILCALVWAVTFFPRRRQIPLVSPQRRVPTTKPLVDLIAQPSTMRLRDPEFLIKDKFVEGLQSDELYKRIMMSFQTPGENYIFTGYGSFGGTTAVKEAIKQAYDKYSMAILPVYFELFEPTLDSLTTEFHITVDNFTLGNLRIQSLNEDNLPVKLVLHRKLLTDLYVKITPWWSLFQWLKTKKGGYSGNAELDVQVLVEGLVDFSNGKRNSHNPIYHLLEELAGRQTIPPRIAIIIDGLQQTSILETLHNEGLFSSKHSINAFVLTRHEDFEKWSIPTRRLQKMKFTTLYIPCLWNHREDYIPELLSRLVEPYNIRTSKAENNYSALIAHLAFIGRGSLGDVIHELRNKQYWMQDLNTQEYQLVLEDPGNIRVMEHNRMKQEILSIYWDLILPGNNKKPEQIRDRERRGIYFLLDWIDPYVKEFPRHDEYFSSQDLLQKALVDRLFNDGNFYYRTAEVIWNLTEVLSRTGYLESKNGRYRVPDNPRLRTRKVIHKVKPLPSEWREIAANLLTKMSGRLASHYVEILLPLKAVSGQKIELQLATKGNLQKTKVEQNNENSQGVFQVGFNVSTSTAGVEIEPVSHGNFASSSTNFWISVPKGASYDPIELAVDVYLDTAYSGSTAIELGVVSTEDTQLSGNSQKVILPFKPDETIPAPDIAISISRQNVTGGYRYHYRVQVAHNGAEPIDDAIYIEGPNPYQYFSSKFAQFSQRNVSDDELDTIGLELWAEVIPQRIKEVIWTALHGIKPNSKPSILIVEDKNAWIPWECLRTCHPEDTEQEGDFLCLQASLTRWIREPVGPPSTIDIKRVGLSIDTNLLHAKEEANNIRSLFSEKCEVEEIELRYEALTQYFQTGGCSIIHLVCHGRHNPNDPNDSVIQLSDYTKTITPSLIRGRWTTFSKDKPLVFLNACETGQQGMIFSNMGGWAMAFVKEGKSSAFIGSVWSIRDASAVSFAKIFYQFLLEKDMTIGESVRLAREAIRQSGDTSWLSYTVYAHPNARIAIKNEKG